MKTIIVDDELWSVEQFRHLCHVSCAVEGGIAHGNLTVAAHQPDVFQNDGIGHISADIVFRGDILQQNALGGGYRKLQGFRGNVDHRRGGISAGLVVGPVAEKDHQTQGDQRQQNEILFLHNRCLLL